MPKRARAGEDDGLMQERPDAKRHKLYDPEAIEDIPDAPIALQQEDGGDYWLRVVRRRAGSAYDRPTLYMRAPRILGLGDKAKPETGTNTERAVDVEEKGSHEKLTLESLQNALIVARARLSSPVAEGTPETVPNQFALSSDGQTTSQVATSTEESATKLLQSAPAKDLVSTPDNIHDELAGLESNTPRSKLNMVESKLATSNYKLRRAQDAVLVAPPVQPFVDPNATEYATNTGIWKQLAPLGISSDTSYTPDVEHIVSNTGATKGAWGTGVDPETEYAGDVMSLPVVDAVHKGVVNLEDVRIAVCHEPLIYARYRHTNRTGARHIINRGRRATHAAASSMLLPDRPVTDDQSALAPLAIACWETHASEVQSPQDIR
ncbi:hypothetical protein ACEQ8H_001441 [Pleosporales sp. CAS-2024a]